MDSVVLKVDAIVETASVGDFFRCSSGYALEARLLNESVNNIIP